MKSAKLKSLAQGSGRKEYVDELIDHILQNPNEIEGLFDIFLNGDSKKRNFISWALGHIGEKRPLLLQNFHELMIQELEDTTLNGVKRNFVRALSFAQIDKNHSGSLYQICFKFITNNNESVAVKAFSILICQKICSFHPEMKNELSAALEPLVLQGSSGLKFRAREGLKFLSNL